MAFCQNKFWQGNFSFAKMKPFWQGQLPQAIGGETTIASVFLWKTEAIGPSDNWSKAPIGFVFLLCKKH